ncbi:hypothetical protein [Streptomyces sp. B27]|uniref:hypothetical protein n=1 Tax=Streptomyces TaxID=1883 RepID=UPI0013E2875B|nr:hypothetical protein [Streptomyces sp. B27]
MADEEDQAVGTPQREFLGDLLGALLVDAVERLVQDGTAEDAEGADDVPELAGVAGGQ